MRKVQEGLLSVTPRDRMGALLHLLALPDAAQAHALLTDHASGDADPRVRQVAQGSLRLLDERVDPTAASSIAPPKQLSLRFHELLRDPRPRVRLGALAQVLKYKGGILVELVEGAMAHEEDPDVLGAMVAVLGQRGSNAHLGAIAELLAHPEPGVVERAVHATAELGREAVLPLLEPLRQSGIERLRAAAVAACDALDPNRPVVKAVRPQAADVVAERLTSPDPRERLAGLEAAAAHMADPGIEGLVEVLSELDAEPRVAAAAHALLGSVTRRAAAEALTPSSPADSAELHESRAKLAASGSEAAGPDGRSDDLAGDPDASRFALGAPTDLPPRQLAEQRLRARLKAPDERTRLEALAALRAHPVKALLPVVLERLEVEDLSAVKAALIGVVGTIGSDAEVPRLTGYLCHANPRVVRASVIALYRLAGDDAVPLFLTLLARPDTRIVEQAIAALMRLGPDKLLAYVITMAKSPREDVRGRALTLLERLGTPATEDLVLDMLEREHSDHLIPREMFLLARHASPRSIPLIWTIRCRRPPLTEQFQLLINKLSVRWGLTVEEVRARGEVYVDEHPEVLEPPRSVVPPEPPKRWVTASLPDEIDRRWVGLAALVIGAYTCFTFDIGGFRTVMATGGLSSDAERELQEQAVGLSLKPLPVLPDLPSTVYGAALEAVAASFVKPLADPPRDVVMARERARLKALGITHEPYLDMEARAAVRAPSNRARRDATDRIARGDLEGALAVLKEALSKVEPENYLIRSDLTREIAQLLVKIGRLSEARAMALLQVDLRKKIVSIRRAASRPGGASIGTFAEEKAAENAAADINAAFDEAARRIAATGSASGLLPEEREAARAALDALAREGKIKPERLRQGLAQLETK